MVGTLMRYRIQRDSSVDPVGRCMSNRPVGTCDDRPVPPPFVTYLRVYEPLVAFDRERQQFWRRYVNDGRPVPPARGPAWQRQLVLDAVGIGWTKLPDLPEDAYVIEDEGALLVCPWNLRIRVAEAALTARQGVPAVIADAFVPPALAGSAERVVADWRSGARVLEQGAPRLHELASGWGVPVRWFAFVDLDERDISVEKGERHLRYRTTMARARRRGHRALAVLRRSVGDSPVTSGMAECVQWLEEFHPRSVVELDYGGLVNVLTNKAMLADDSPGLAADGLAALARGDVTAAGEVYERLVERWRAVQLMERCN